jgi:large subunit ribosomal protein L22
MPRAQGRAFQILKRTSHITIVVATPDELGGKN